MNIVRDCLNEQDVNTFVGKNADYYKEKWNAHPNTSFYKGWNGVAFVFFLEWASYRKMYMEAVFAFLGILVFAVIFSFSPINSDFLGKFSGQAIKLLLSAFANGLYHKKALRAVHQTIGLDAADKIEYLTKKGGTSITSLIICLLFEIVIFFLPTMIFQMLINI